VGALVPEQTLFAKRAGIKPLTPKKTLLSKFRGLEDLRILILKMIWPMMINQL